MHLQRGQTLAVHGCAVDVANVVEDLQAIILCQSALGIDVCDDTTSLIGWSREITWGVTQCTVLYRIWYFTLTWLFLPPVTMTPNGFFSIFTSMRIFLFGFISAVAGSCGFSSSFLTSARAETEGERKMVKITRFLTYPLSSSLPLRAQLLWTLHSWVWAVSWWPRPQHASAVPLPMRNKVNNASMEHLTHALHRSWTPVWHPDW